MRANSSALAVSVVGLVVALGGTSYAVARLPLNSVGSGQIKPRAVQAADVGADAVSSSKVRDGSLRAGDFAPDQLPAGPAGAAGPAGPPGERGETGAAGISGLERVGDETSAAPGTQKRLTVPCPAGKQALSGGFMVDDPDGDGSTRVMRSHSTSATAGWGVVVANSNPEEPWQLWVIATCARTAQ